MSERHAFFLLNHLQDVNVVRPLVFLARSLGLRTAFLASRQFIERDKHHLWRKEIGEIGEATASPLHVFESALQALRPLQEKSGVLVAGSESDVHAHAPSHEVLRIAPASFVGITLQHGYECLGFLHNRAHDQGFGREVGFAADVVCGWADAAHLKSLAPSQRAKLYVSGPPALLQMQHAAGRRPPRGTGLVCENLHSVRLSVAANLKGDFIGMFTDFSAALAREGRGVVLRPHPGGQYGLRPEVGLPPNALLNNHPMYKVDLASYAYGISAPSSVVIDFVLAGIPVAVWRDAAGAIDASNYHGLTEISTLADWIDFSREAVAHPERFLERQRRFLEATGMPTEPREVHARFARLLGGAAQNFTPLGARGRRTERVLFVANGLDPTLQLCLMNPLAPLVEAREMEAELITAEQIREKFGKRPAQGVVAAWLGDLFASFKPTLLLFCRYGGGHASHLLELAHQRGTTVVYHIDDDLLNIPEQLGLAKFKYHHEPARLAVVRQLLDNADLVYCSTPRLQERFAALGVKAPLFAGAISCAGRVLVPAAERPVRRVGYMGFDKIVDLEMILPVLVQYLRRNAAVEFHLFGAFTKPAALDEFGERIALYPPVRNYEDFLAAFAQMGWDIGICPLLPAEFNRLKANNKWIEYTAVGAAVIASAGTIYDESCAGGCGLLAGTADEWLAALERLTRDPAERFALVRRAQQKLAAEYSTERLRDQLLAMFVEAKSKPPRTPAA